jgi:hypothetical protein
MPGHCEAKEKAPPEGRAFSQWVRMGAQTQNRVVTAPLVQEGKHSGAKQEPRQSRRGFKLVRPSPNTERKRWAGQQHPSESLAACASQSGEPPRRNQPVDLLGGARRYPLAATAQNSPASPLMAPSLACPSLTCSRASPIAMTVPTVKTPLTLAIGTRTMLRRRHSGQWLPCATSGHRSERHAGAPAH